MGNELDINKITAEVITDLSKSIARKLYDKAAGFLKDSQNKMDVEIGTAYEEYLNYSKSIHEKIKTLLYRHTPKNIYSFYECIGLDQDDDEIDASDVRNILDIGNKIIVSGSGGMGKSILLKHFFLNTLLNTDYVPVLIELRGVNDYDEKTLDLQGYIYAVMESMKFKLEKKYFDYSLDLGCYVILLDGFDEVKSEIIQQVTNQIFELCRKYPNNHYILSSRPMPEFIGWHQFEELRSMPLSKTQALSLINKIEYDETTKQNFYHELDENLYDKYETFASNPLLLTIMLLTYENRASIPDKLNDFFEQAFTTLFHAHDATKGGYKRDIQSKLGYEDFKTVFAYFCFKSFFASSYNFTENQALEYIGYARKKDIIKTDFDSIAYLKDLTNSVCMLVHDGLDYRFSHRSFQEYFAALYTIQLDDFQQKSFLKSWLESNGNVATNYLDMLYDLQPNRYIKNLIAPAINELYDKFVENDRSAMWLTKTLYKNVSAMVYEGSLVSAYTVNNNYYSTMLAKACQVGEYYTNSDEKTKEKHRETEDKFAHYLFNKYDLDENVEFDELVNDIEDNELLERLYENAERLQFAEQFIKGFIQDSFAGKNHFSSMLEEL